MLSSSCDLGFEMFGRGKQLHSRELWFSPLIFKCWEGWISSYVNSFAEYFMGCLMGNVALLLTFTQNHRSVLCVTKNIDCIQMCSTSIWDLKKNRGVWMDPSVPLLFYVKSLHQLWKDFLLKKLGLVQRHDRCLLTLSLFYINVRWKNRFSLSYMPKGILVTALFSSVSSLGQYL